MGIVASVVALLLIVTVLWDAFETVVLPRRVTRPFRIAFIVYLATWQPWRALARRMPDGRREGMLSYYGPLSLLFLLAAWAMGMVVGFALLQWGQGSPLSVPYGHANFAVDLYMSGTTFVTLGLGDVAPHTTAARAVTVIEAATGFAFLALIVGYVPVLYQAFSRREVDISLLDARAGSPPSGVELLRRYAQDDDMDGLAEFLLAWERWAADLLESHLSYPNLAFYRSQHDNQSWVAALTAILDTCALVLAGVDGAQSGPARLAFGMARHAAADLSQVLGARPKPPETVRLPPEDLARVRLMLSEAGIPLRDGADVDRHLADLRALYEPYVYGIADLCLLSLPPWLPGADAIDDWQRTAWESMRKRGARALLD
jgi:hypothetical protein